MLRWCGWIGIAAAVACGGSGGNDHSATATLAGDALPFAGGPNGRIGDATIGILEEPDRSVVTGADGHFEFPDLTVGREYTLFMEHPDYSPIQTGTLRLPLEGTTDVTFQAVTPEIYDALAMVVGITPDSERCQMVTTITRVGKSIYNEGAHGEAGAVVTLDPPLPAEHGPIYFNANVLPQRDLIESSEDGGVLFTNVPEGEYVWTAEKPGVAFRPIRMKCRAGWLVNASPPWGLQALP